MSKLTTRITRMHIIPEELMKAHKALQRTKSKSDDVPCAMVIMCNKKPSKKRRAEIIQQVEDLLDRKVR